MKKLMWTGLLVVALVWALAGMSLAVTCREMLTEEKAAWCATHVVTLTDEDLVEATTNKAETVALMSVEDKLGVTLVGVQIVAGLDDTGTNLLGIGMTVGDGNDASRFLGTTEVCANTNTVPDMAYPRSIDTNTIYTAADTVDATFTPGVEEDASTALTNLTSGELRFYFRVFDAR
jgi:hypothetical protein